MGSDWIGSARRLLARPAFTALAVLTLSLGIGAGTAVFSVAAGVLFRPPPYRSPEQLVEPYFVERLEELRFPAPVPASVIEAWQALPEVTEVAGYDVVRGVAFLDGGPVRLDGARATVNLFSLLGVEPKVGRVFAADDDPSAVVVLDEELFARALGGDPARLGERLRFDDGSRTVIGVVPQGLELVYRSPRYWVPASPADGPHGASLTGIARLAPGVAPARARDLLEVVWRDLEGAAATGIESVRVEPFARRLTGPARAQLLVLAITAALVLAIGCANIGGLFLGQVEGRGEELAIRRALGASRWRLVRLLLAEGAWLAGAGGVAGLLLAVGLHRFLAAKVVSNVPGREGVALDWRAFAAVLVLSVLAALVVSLVPALWTLRRDPVRALSSEARAGRGRRGTRARHLAVVVQLALALVLLLNAGLVLGALLQHIGLAGPVHPESVVALRLLVPPAGLDGLAETGESASVWPLVERLRALPGVESAAIGSYVPYVSEGWAAIQFSPAPLDERAAGHMPGFEVDATFAAYATFAGPLFQVLGVPLTAGDVVAAGGPPSHGAPVVVNERLARDYWPGENPIGKTLYLPGGRTTTVSGVIDLELAGLPRLVLRGVGETAWAPLRTQSFGILARTTGESEELIAQARALVGELAPHVAVERAATLEEMIAEQNAPYRLRGLLHGSIGLLALTLALVGVYGVMSRLASSRTREIGVRLTLGARRSQVLAMMLGTGARLVTAGLAAGIGGAWAGARLLGSAVPELVPTTAGGGFLPFGIVENASASVWLTVGGAPALLAATTLLACLLPARRASRVDPVEALRS